MLKAVESAAGPMDGGSRRALRILRECTEWVEREDVQAAAGGDPAALARPLPPGAMSDFSRTVRKRSIQTSMPGSGRVGRGRAGTMLLASALALAGCAVGPRFAHPTPPAASALTTKGTAPDLTPGHGERPQHLAAGQAIPAQWWGLFHSQALAGILRQALADNPTLAAARARLAQARQAVLAARGGYYRQWDVGATAERQKGPAFALGLLGMVPGARGLPVNWAVNRISPSRRSR